MLSTRTVGTAEISPAIAAAITRLGTLGEALRRPELEFVDVIIQDEYTHDIVFAATSTQQSSSTTDAAATDHSRVQFVVFDAT